MKKINLAKIKTIQPNYKFASIIEVNKEYKVDGLNIWNHYWNCSDRCVEVIDPFERQIYCFKEYEIKSNDKTVKFVAGEFSNGEIGIFIKDELIQGIL